MSARYLKVMMPPSVEPPRAALVGGARRDPVWFAWPFLAHSADMAKVASKRGPTGSVVGRIQRSGCVETSAMNVRASPTPRIDAPRPLAALATAALGSASGFITPLWEREARTTAQDPLALALMFERNMPDLAAELHGIARSQPGIPD